MSKTSPFLMASGEGGSSRASLVAAECVRPSAPVLSPAAHTVAAEDLKSSAATVCAAGLSTGALGRTHSAATSDARLEPPSPLAIKKGLVFDMLPEKLSYGDRFKLARVVVFE